MAVKYGGKFIDTFLKGMHNLSLDVVSTVEDYTPMEHFMKNIYVLHLILIINEVCVPACMPFCSCFVILDIFFPSITSTGFFFLVIVTVIVFLYC